jgi:hypothetical protein
MIGSRRCVLTGLFSLTVIFTTKAAVAACSYQVLPPNGSDRCVQMTCTETTWKVCLRHVGMKGIWISSAQLRRTAASPFMLVLSQAGPAEIFVPYHQGTDRLYDMQFGAPVAITPQDVGPGGTPVVLPNQNVAHLGLEIRDLGLSWLCKQSTSSSRRKQALILWSVYDGGNYDNIIEYGFHEDGKMVFRTGTTGYTNPNFSDAPHMHDTLWRIDMDLGGGGNDGARITTHQEQGTLTASDQETSFNGGVEASLAWDPLTFTGVLIEDQVILNKFSHKIGYEAVPIREGTARHFGTEEEFTRNDFYVTRWNGNELGWMTNHQVPDLYLFPSMNNEPITGHDLVLWHVSSAHHHPHDEDHASNDSSSNPNSFNGMTQIHWSGLELRPHNLFDYNPLGGPSKCGN